MAKCPLLAGYWLAAHCLLAATCASGQTIPLSIKGEQGQLVLSWPSWASDGLLEQARAINQTFISWTNAVPPALYRLDSEGYHYAIPAAGSNGFFRVRRTGSPVPGLEAYWSLDDLSGSIDLALGGGPRLQQTNITWSPGRGGAGSWRFNGLQPENGGSLAWVSNSNYALLPGNAPFAVSFWFCPDVLRNTQLLMGNDGPQSTNGWHISLNTLGPGTNQIVAAGVGNGTAFKLSSRTLLVPGDWHHLALAFMSNQASLYLDGRLLDQTQTPASLGNSEAPLYIGGRPNMDQGFSGSIDELRVFTTQITAEQVAETGHWDFEENSGRLAADRSMHGQVAAVVSPEAWVAGKNGHAVDLKAGPVVVANEGYRVLPSTGEPFSLSFWLKPRNLPTGKSGLLHCSGSQDRGWQLVLDMAGPGSGWLEFSSTNFGGTLALRAPVTITDNAWTRIDLTFNGGIAAIFQDGRLLRSELGAIAAASAPLIIGEVPGAVPFNGIFDELRIFNRERHAWEIGPVAEPMWEMALVNSSTNLVLRGSGPPGKHLTFTISRENGTGLGEITQSGDSAGIVYTAGGRKGPDYFAYTVSDGEFTSLSATGVVSVVQPHWLSPSGGTRPPLDGSSPAKAWMAAVPDAIDAIWRTNDYFDCFFYSPGEFQTKGWRYPDRPSGNPGCKHIGSGSEGPLATVLKLVGTVESWNEGLIFASQRSPRCDCFEVHNLVLDCNGDNNPKHVYGEPVWVRIPLVNTTRVDNVSLQWSDPWKWETFRMGAAAAFEVSARSPKDGASITNSMPIRVGPQLDKVALGVETDEVLMRLTRREANVSFYGLNKIEIPGAEVSLPVARTREGAESVLDPRHSILEAFDDDPKSSWASGNEDSVEITLPLQKATALNQLYFRWNCQTLTNLHRLGPAAAYALYYRDEQTGQYVALDFATLGRGADGRETVSFGPPGATNTILTDRLLLLLAAREPGVDSYSLRDIRLSGPGGPVSLRMPSALNTLGYNSFSKTFRTDTNHFWASGTQGSVAGVDIGGSHLKFTGLRVIGFGTKQGRECFPLIVLGPPLSPDRPEPMRNVLVENCVFAQPATNNTDGVTAVLVAGQGTGALLNGVVRGCKVLGLGPQFSYSHGFTAARVEQCLVDDCQAAVYFEPDPKLSEVPDSETAGLVLIRSNVFQNVLKGVAVEFHPAGKFDSLVCSDNEIVLKQGAGPGVGIYQCDACVEGLPGLTTSLAALNNVIRYPNWLPSNNSFSTGLVYGNVQHAIYGNNVLVLSTSTALRIRSYPAGITPDEPEPEDCNHPRLVVRGPSTVPPSLDPLLPGYRRAWFNNRDLSGTLLPVVYSEFGNDRLAAQQQWPK